jgi:hypothetical protein
VNWHSTHKKWQAHISLEGKMTWLGYFDSKEEAISIRKLAEIERSQVMELAGATE